MTTRLQVIFADDEIEEIRAIARRHHMTVAEWVRQALREARRDEPGSDSRKKFLAVREAMQGSYPVSDIQQMLTEIESGYHTDSSL